MISAFSRCATGVCSSPEVPWGCDQNSVVRTLLEKGSQHPDITEKRAVNRAASLTDDRSGVNIFSSALLANLKINQHNKSESRVGTGQITAPVKESRVGTGQISAPVKYRRRPPAELCFAENLPDSGPSLFVCYPRPLARLQTQTSSTRDPNFILVSFHFLSYLTCPLSDLSLFVPSKDTTCSISKQLEFIQGRAHADGAK
jgi:hypothetical protein